LQNGPQTDSEDSPTREKFLTHVKKVTVEQSGPVRGVVRIEGTHKGVKSGREWLPFTVRLYFYGGLTTVRMVHTIVFDGDQEKDFVRGLGVQMAAAARRIPNRTVRLLVRMAARVDHSARRRQRRAGNRAAVHWAESSRRTRSGMTSN
jgi:hypothetical protein